MGKCNTNRKEIPTKKMGKTESVSVKATVFANFRCFFPVNSNVKNAFQFYSFVL